MHIKPITYTLTLALCCLLIYSCSPPRSVLTSGKVLPKGQVRFGINGTVNASSASIERSVKSVKNLAESALGNDTVIFSQQVANLNSAFIAYCLDPVSYNTEFYFRYGLGHRFDIGYRNTGGANAFDVMYQFLGSNKNFKESDVGGLYGSIGAQYSWQNYNFINFSRFDEVQKILGLDMTRKDITIPLVFSTSFGPEERSGCFSFGVVYSHSFIRYEITPENIYVEQAIDNLEAELVIPVSHKSGFNAYGTFMNIKVGRRYVFFNFSLAMYYQNYGRYPLIGGSEVSLKGISIVPSYGIQFNLLPKTKKKPAGGMQM